MLCLTCIVGVRRVLMRRWMLLLLLENLRPFGRGCGHFVLLLHLR